MRSCNPLDVDMAVFSRGSDIALFEISEAAVAQVRAQGYTYCGVIAIEGGEPRVTCMPGDDAVASMLQAGYHFAEWLGPRLKELQLEHERCTQR